MNVASNFFGWEFVGARVALKASVLRNYRK
jgi:hypothetical protein